MSEGEIKLKHNLLKPRDEPKPAGRASFAPGIDVSDEDKAKKVFSWHQRKGMDKYDRLILKNPFTRHGTCGGRHSCSNLGFGNSSSAVALRRASFAPGVWECYGTIKSVEEKEGSSAINSFTPSSYHTIPEESMPPHQVEITKRRALKNVTLLGLAFTFVYSAFISLQSLKSTMHSESGLGVVSLSCVYGMTVISCFLAPWVIKRVTTKWTIVVSFILFTAYFTTHYYPYPETIIPASLILGLACGPLWSAQATYITTLAIRYSQSSGEDGDYLVNKFLCLFCGLFQTSQIWGNLISVLILTSGTIGSTPMRNNPTATSDSTYDGYSLNIHEPHSTSTRFEHMWPMQTLAGNYSQQRSQCGAMYCKIIEDTLSFGAPDYGELVEPIPQRSVYFLVSLYLGCGVMGIVVAAALLERFDNTNKDEIFSIALSGKELRFNTFDMLKDYRCQLLIPLVIFVGMQQAFMFGDFTKFYVNCTLGVNNIGPIFITFGAISALSSITIGYISKHIKRIAIITAGAVFNIGLLMVLWLWRPRPWDLPNFFVVSGCLGLCDAIWQTQTYTLFGVLFMDRQEAAFATHRMFLSTGCAVAFGYSHYLCVETKVYLLAGVLIPSLVLYSIIEIKLQWQSQHIRNIVSL